jgi:hypothetical protein
MIIIPVVGSLLRPFPSIISSPDFLSNRWIGHIEKAEKKAAQMGEMSNPTPCSFGGREEFDETEDDDKVFGGYWEEEVDVDKAVGKEPTKGEEQTVDGSGSSDNQYVLMSKKDHGKYTSANPTEEKKS